MRKEIAAPYAQGDEAALADHLTELLRFNPEPDHWKNWNRFARSGIAAARKHRDPVLSCVRCHAVYRAEYNAKYRDRALPEK